MKPKSGLIIEELLGEKFSNSHEEIVPRPIVVETPTEVEPSVPRRSWRVVRQPDRYGLFDAEGQTYIAIINESNDDPISYSKAMASSDANLWQKAMDAEIHSIYSNGIWTLIDPPEGIKPIGCKWIYKKKKGSDGFPDAWLLHVNEDLAEDGVSDLKFAPFSLRVVVSSHALLLGRHPYSS